MPPTFDAVYLDLILGFVSGGAVGFGSGLRGAKATLVTEVTAAPQLGLDLAQEMKSRVTAAAPTGSGLGG